MPLAGVPAWGQGGETRLQALDRLGAQLGQVERERLARAVFDPVVDEHGDEGAVHRDVPAQGHGVDDIVDGLGVVAVLEANASAQAGQGRQRPRRLRVGKQELDPVFIAEAPVTARQRRRAVHHPQRVIGLGHDFPCVSVQGHCQVLRVELVLLGVGKLGQLGERLPVLEGGVGTQVGGSVRGRIPQG